MTTIAKFWAEMGDHSYYVWVETVALQDDDTLHGLRVEVQHPATLASGSIVIPVGRPGLDDPDSPAPEAMDLYRFLYNFPEVVEATLRRVDAEGLV